MEITTITAWTFISEVAIPADIYPMLVEGEQRIAAYRTFRDSAVSTNRRLIVRDAQGVTGRRSNCIHRRTHG